MKLEKATFWAPCTRCTRCTRLTPPKRHRDTPATARDADKDSDPVGLRRRVINDGPFSRLRASHRRQRVLWRRRGAQRVISKWITRGNTVSECLHPRGAPKVRSDAMRRSRAARNSTPYTTHMYVSLGPVVKRADLTQCDARRLVSGSGGLNLCDELKGVQAVHELQRRTKSSSGSSGTPPQKPDYQHARVKSRGVGAFDDRPEREIHVDGIWRGVSCSADPSHRVAAHLWCAPWM